MLKKKLAKEKELKVVIRGPVHLGVGSFQEAVAVCALARFKKE